MFWFCFFSALLCHLEASFSTVPSMSQDKKATKEGVQREAAGQRLSHHSDRWPTWIMMVVGGGPGIRNMTGEALF